MRIDRLVYGALWLGLVGWWLLFSPPLPQDFLGELTALAVADTSRIDPIAIAVFNLLGVLPTAFLGIVLFDTGRPRPWPFAVGAYVLGGLILLPYLVLRDTRAPLDASPGMLARSVGSRAAGWTLLVAAAALIGFGLVAGSPGAFAAQLAGSQLIAMMSMDLLALTAALHIAAATDRRRRELPPATAWQHLPLIGPLIYLATRRKPPR